MEKKLEQMDKWKLLEKKNGKNGTKSSYNTVIFWFIVFRLFFDAQKKKNVSVHL